MGNNVFIAYYTRSGNTRKIAELIQKESGGTVFEIVPEEAYPPSYNAVVEQAKKEIREGLKPALKYKADNIGEYDTVFIGSPNWWSTIAPPVRTFLSEYDISGKTVIPFCTHGGGGEARVLNDIAGLCPGSNILSGVSFYGGGGTDAHSRISEWLRGAGLLR